MAEAIWPAKYDNEPAYAYWQMAFFIRSAVIVSIWLLADSLIRVCPQLLCGIFSSLKVDNRTIRAFGMNILSTNDERGVQVAGRILSAYTWVVLSSVVFSVVFLWNSLIVRTWSLDVGRFYLWNRAVRSCLEGSKCYSLDAVNDIYHFRSIGMDFGALMKRALWWDLAPSCDFLVQQANSAEAYEVIKQRDRRFRIVLCHHLWPEQSLAGMFGSLCLGIAILIIQQSMFETLVLLMLRESKHRFRTFSALVVCFAVILVLVYLYSTIRNTFWGISTSSADVAALLALAVILAQARRVSGILRTLREIEIESRMKSLQETTLGQEIDRAFCCRSGGGGGSGDEEKRAAGMSNTLVENQLDYTPAGSSSTSHMRAKAQNFIQKLLNKPPTEN